MKTLWYVIERDVYDRSYRRDVQVFSQEDDAWRESLRLTKSYSGGGKYYIVETRKDHLT